MNNLSYTSHVQSINVVHASAPATDMIETISGTVSEMFDIGSNLESNSSTTLPTKNDIEQEGKHSFPTYQPIANGSILPVHQLLF